MLTWRAVDERLIADGRLRRLTTPDGIEIVKRKDAAGDNHRVRRDPGLMAALLVGAQP